MCSAAKRSFCSFANKNICVGNRRIPTRDLHGVCGVSTNYMAIGRSATKAFLVTFFSKKVTILFLCNYSTNQNLKPLACHSGGRLRPRSFTSLTLRSRMTPRRRAQRPIESQYIYKRFYRFTSFRSGMTVSLNQNLTPTRHHTNL